MEFNSTTTFENTTEENLKKIKSKKKKTKKSGAKKPKTLKELLKNEPKTTQKKNLKDFLKKNSIKSEDSYKFSRDSKNTTASETRDSISKNSFEPSVNKIQEKEFSETQKETFPFSLSEYFSEAIEFLKKNEKSVIDFSNSKNFMTKEDFIKQKSVEKEKEKEKKVEAEVNEKEIYENYNYAYDYNSNYNYGCQDFQNFEQKFKLQPFFTYPEIMIVDSKHSKFDDFSDNNMLYDGINNCYSNKYNKNMGKKKCNFFIRRRGDWLCEICGNLNFGYRESCNRCKALKQ